jgi:hypothetical protein
MRDLMIEEESLPMFKFRNAGVICAIAIALTAIVSGDARAEETVCRGLIGAVTLDNVRVPQNAICNLDGTRVKGTVKVETRATLLAEDVVVIGNVQAEGARDVTIRDASRVGGSVQVVQGGAATVANSRINGDIQYDENSEALSIRRNRIGGNVQVMQNTGGVEIRNNNIEGNLQCKANNPPPVGGGNIVEGNKEDQCSRL